MLFFEMCRKRMFCPTHQLPKLYPLWHSSTFSKHTCSSCQVDFKLIPDYGGAGVDVIMTSNSGSVQRVTFSLSSLKSEVGIENITSKKCVLPFTPPNVLDNVNDPCCSKLEWFRNKEKKYTNSVFRIVHCRSTLRKNSYKTLQQKLLAKKQEEFLIPQTLFDMAAMMPEIYPVPRANWLYSGGCLASVSCNKVNKGMPLLIHPAGKQLNEACVTFISESSNYNKIFTYLDQQCVKVNENILQISAESFEERILCCVRQKNFCDILLIEPENIGVENVLQSTNNALLYSCPSPYIQGEYIIITQNGHLMLKHISNNDSIWDSFQTTNLASVVDARIGCEFGSHPRCLIYSNGQSLALVDTRSKHYKSIEIFNISCPFLVPKEEITVSKLNISQPFQHFIGTTHHMTICDERYPKQPLSIWNHLLESYPLHCSITPFSNKDDIYKMQILLGTHFPQQTTCFYLKSALQPVSCFPSLHLSAPKEIIDYLKLEGISIEDSVVQRLSAPITGVCSIPHNYGFVFFQLSSLGDIFYQDYFSNVDEEKTNSVGPGCSFKAPFNKSDIDWWINKVKKNFHSIATESLVQIDCSQEFNDLRSSDISSKECNFCNKMELTESGYYKICHVCNAYMNDSECLLNLLERSCSEKNAFDMNKEFLNEEMDPLTKDMYDVWFKQDEPDSIMVEEQNVLENSLADENNFFKNIESNDVSSVQPIIAIQTNSFDTTQRSEEIEASLTEETEDIIPPSQELSELCGETIRIPLKKPKIRLSSAVAGF